MINHCIGCEYYEPIGDGYAVCTKESIPVRTIDDYEPTDYYNRCEIVSRKRMQRLLSGTMYGEMAYQKED